MKVLFYIKLIIALIDKINFFYSKLKTSFSIRNLKRSIIKDFHSKEESKRKHFGASQSPNQNNNEKSNLGFFN